MVPYQCRDSMAAPAAEQSCNVRPFWWFDLLYWGPNEIPRKRSAAKGDSKRQPAGHKRRTKCKLHGVKKHGQSQVRKQDQKKEPILKVCMSSYTLDLTAYWRAPDLEDCYICGQDDHDEHFCPCNYIYGLYDRFTCRARCLPGQHTLTSIAHQKFLERFIRLNNMPPSFRQWDLKRLVKPFGPLLMCDVPMIGPEHCRGFGVVIFKKREDGERAINELNGFDVGDRKLRVEWVYPSVLSGLN